MERTKYTPKRLLSLLLALIMLLGMFPTAALAAEPAGGIVLNSDDYKAHGLIFKFEPILPEGPYFENSTDKAVTIHYTISTATGEDYVKITELSEFVRYNNAEGGEIANSRVTVKASDITDTNMANASARVSRVTQKTMRLLTTFITHCAAAPSSASTAISSPMDATAAKTTCPGPTMASTALPTRIGI